MRQLDLFEQPNLATVAVFPPARQRQLVRYAAEIISSTEHDAAEAFWRELLRQIGVPLLDAGVPLDRVRAAAIALSEAVSAEMLRIDPIDPKGAPSDTVADPSGGESGQKARSLPRVVNGCIHFPVWPATERAANSEQKERAHDA